MLIKPGNLLKTIESPEDLRVLDKQQLLEVCQELRQYIVDNVSIYGGHFAASLGVIELTVALHYVFNTPKDELIFDVGHQAYGHKILTGRRDNFHTNRVYNGLSGFPKRTESEYDSFGVGHSSTSISAALGMAMASKIKGDKEKHHIAVIGDGAMTGGMAFEAMNHAGVSNSNLLIVLNDNCMSIDPNVGALKDYLTDITTSELYNKFRDELWKALGKLNKLAPKAREVASKIEGGMKAIVLKQSNLFESLGIRYFGPIDGHDIDHLVSVLNDLKKIEGPKILHCVTVKGKGFSLAEKDQTKWHSPGKFDKITGEIKKKTFETPQPPKYQDVFGLTLVELAEQNDKIVGITPAMPSGSSMNLMMKAFPERSFDVGIAEQHAVTLSAGIATQGLTPFCNIYSTFMQRGFDQVVHDVCIQKLPVVFCLDRAGLVGADGPTHHGAYDIAYLRCLPNIVIAAPMDEIELRNLMFTASTYKEQAFAIRYPRGEGQYSNWQLPFEKIEIGKSRLLKQGKDIAILSIGNTGNFVKKAYSDFDTHEISVAHYDMRFVKPLDFEALHHICATFDKLITIEDACLPGGFGSAIAEFICDNGYNVQLKRLGIPDRIVEHGEPDQLYKECEYDTQAIVSTTLQMAGVLV